MRNIEKDSITSIIILYIIYLRHTTIKKFSPQLVIVVHFHMDFYFPEELEVAGTVAAAAAVAAGGTILL